MDATAGLTLTPPPPRLPPRSLSNRIAGVGVVLLGAAFLFGGGSFFFWVAGSWGTVFGRFGLRGGLPRPTQVLLSVYELVAAHQLLVCVTGVLVTAAVAFLVARLSSRRALRLAAWFTAGCFFLVYGSLHLLLIWIVLVAFGMLTW